MGEAILCPGPAPTWHTAPCRPAQPSLALTPAPAPGWACSMSTPDPGAVQTLHALSPHCPLCPARPNVKTLLPPPRPESFSEVSSLGAASYTGISAFPELVPGWPSRHARPTPGLSPPEGPLPSYPGWRRRSRKVSQKAWKLTRQWRQAPMPHTESPGPGTLAPGPMAS